ncbi:MAG TPA: tannase/feruloyl esterase family alpha/beta hydrolase [Alloacidobacterium sp.]|jgi:feruloyl esterase|nr:tannase/feruloyl esterase family alpha/beta hydrolase [Alloacidobacterium sp.]
MKKHFFLLLLLLLIGSFGPPLKAATCDGLAQLSSTHIKITSAELISSGVWKQREGESLLDLPPFCRVAATLIPSPDSAIRVELWLPVSGWNGKMEGTGNGGYAGSINYRALADGLRRGYAVANTDMGTDHWWAEDGNALVRHPEKWADWGWRATHLMTVEAKKIIAAYYQRMPSHSYFWGCSTGGQQALMEAQRFPDDYDGIIAGAPANNRTHLHIAFLWDFAAAEHSPGSRISDLKLTAMNQAVLNECASAKAAPGDSFLSDPLECHWSPADLLCKSSDAPDCLTHDQVVTANKFYDGPRDPATHRSIYPGEARGTEFGWGKMMPLTGGPAYQTLFKWVVGSDWTWREFNFDRDVAVVDAKLGPLVNATDPDLQIFEAHGHKLLMYHGWADWLLPPQESINYLSAVQNAEAVRIKGESGEEKTRSFLRLFMIPGMAHCADGPGLNSIDPLPALELWVENGVAPDQIIAKRVDHGKTVMSRPVCPYPERTRYNGTGAIDSASSFQCTGL